MNLFSRESRNETSANAAFSVMDLFSRESRNETSAGAAFSVMDLFSRESRNETSAAATFALVSFLDSRLNNQPSGEPPEHVHKYTDKVTHTARVAGIACAFENFPAAFDKSFSDPMYSCVHVR